MHSTLVGSSSAKAFMACPGRRRMIKDIPPTPSSPAAVEGTLLHEALEALSLDENLNPMDFLDPESGITEAVIADKLTPALDAFEDMLEDFDVTEFVTERQVRFTGKLSEAFGTGDLVGRCGDGSVLICDYKFGHQPVDVVNNAQCLFIGAAARRTKQLKTWFTGEYSQPVRFVIIQPTQEPVLQHWSCTVQELLTFELQLEQAYDASGDPDAPTQPGSHCQWCPAAPVCPSKLVQAKAALQLPHDVTLDLETALGLAVQLEPWVKEVKNFAHQMLEQGAEVPGWKLVQKKSRGRVWRDKDAAEKKLKAMRSLKAGDYYNYTLKSPPQLEKTCKTKKVKFDQFDEMVIAAPSGGTTLAEASDPRPAVKAELSQGEMTEALGALNKTA